MKKVVANIREYSKDYFKKAGMKSLVLGVSGGIDSAVVAALMYPVAKELSIPLIGISLPSDSNNKDETERAIVVCKHFTTHMTEYFIDADTDELLNGHAILERCIPNTQEVLDKDVKIIKGNTMARIRMIHLYNIARLTGGLVLSTDNRTEYLLGFWTLHGDVGDFGPIQNLSKQEVYEIADYLVNKEIKDLQAGSAMTRCIDAVPTDGLGISESDFEQLGVLSYNEAEDILEGYLSLKNKEVKSVYEKLKFEDMKKHPVVKRHESTYYKRDNPHNIPLEMIYKGSIDE